MTPEQTLDAWLAQPGLRADQPRPTSVELAGALRDAIRERDEAKDKIRRMIADMGPG